MAKIKGFKAAIEALRGLDEKSQARILSEILKKDPEMAERLRHNLVIFDDLLKVNTQGMHRLFQEIPEPTWVLALRGKKKEFIDALLKPFAKRKVEMFQVALDHLGPQSSAKVEAAQKLILEKALELQQKGLLIFISGDDPLV